MDNQLAKPCTVNLVKLATGRRLRVALVATNPLTEVTCNNSVVEVQSLSVANFTKLTVPKPKGPVVVLFSEVQFSQFSNSESLVYKAQFRQEQSTDIHGKACNLETLKLTVQVQPNYNLSLFTSKGRPSPINYLKGGF